MSAADIPEHMGPQFKAHVANVVASVTNATPAERQTGLDWYPEAHRQVNALARANPAGPGDVDRSNGKRLYTSGASVKRAAGSVAALSPARPSGMRWEY